MKPWQSLKIAFSMYSKIPMPKTDWSPANLGYAFCFFPLIGIPIGALLAFWHFIASFLSVHPVLFASVACVIPLGVTGGIHLDGFCDTVDALSSRQPREKKLEILKDPHTGAFAILGCIAYFLLAFGFWTQLFSSLARNHCAGTFLCAFPLPERLVRRDLSSSQKQRTAENLLRRGAKTNSHNRLRHSIRSLFGSHGGIQLASVIGLPGRKRACFFVLPYDVLPAVWRHYRRYRRVFSSALRAFHAGLCHFYSTDFRRNVSLSIQLILGGSFQGKLSFALQLTGLSPDNVADGGSPNDWLEKPILNGIHRGIRQLLLEESDPYTIVDKILDKNPNAVILCDEIGCGIVPLDPKEREYREVTGRICCMLAKQAQRVIRVQCGIPQVIQGDPL